MVMLLSQNKEHSATILNNQNTEAVENCWKIARSNSWMTKLSRNGQNNEAAKECQTQGGCDRTQGDDNPAEKLTQSQWERNLHKSNSISQVKITKENQWRVFKCDSDRNNGQISEYKTISNEIIWEHLLSKTMPYMEEKKRTVSNKKENITSTAYIWRDTNGQIVSPIKTPTDIGLQYVSIDIKTLFNVSFFPPS